MSNKLDTIQIYRGLAAISVVLFHATGLMASKEGYTLLWGIFKIGYLGVDFFFTLSGFIIYHVHRIDIGTPGKIIPYAKKRMARLYPIFWIVVIPLIIASTFNASSNTQNIDHSTAGIINTLLLLPQPGYPILPVSWTMKHELLFYCMFGLLIGLSNSTAKPIFITWITLTAINQFLPAQHFQEIRKNYIFLFILSGYNFEFLFGLLAAHMIASNAAAKKSIDRLTLTSISIASAVFFMITCIYFSNTINENRIIFAGIPFAILIFASSSIDIGKIGTQNNSAPFRPLMAAGDASYSIYLIHYPILSISYKIASKYNISATAGPLATSALCIGTAIMGGALLHYLIEQPVLNHIRRRIL